MTGFYNGFMQVLKVFGHPVHAALNDIPIGLWVAAVGCQWLAAASGSNFWWAAAFWSLFFGLATAVPIAFVGLHDFTRIPRERPGARSTAARHVAAMGAAAALFVSSLWMQSGPNPPEPTGIPLTLIFSGTGLLFMGIGAWYGAELVFRHGVGRVYEPYTGPERRATPRELVR